MELQALYEIYLKSSGVNTDTRSLSEGQIFFALKGPNFNGNLYAGEALEKGAGWAVVDEETSISHGTILVPNVLKALQQLAQYHREKLGIPVIGVCGSNGKTTTKELIAAVLKTKFKTFSTKGNLNNHIGVPLSLLSIEDGTEIAVIEMGANHPNEISDLCQIAKPTHGLITNIGKDHIEGFGSIEGVAKANGELFDFLAKNNGTAFINTAEPFVLELATLVPNKYTYPDLNNNLYCKPFQDGVFLGIELENGGKFSTNLAGTYNFANVATALAIAKYFNTETETAINAICKYNPQNNRSQVLETKRNTLLLDAYNANPSSMMAALENLANIKTDKPKWVILGDMLELGGTSKTEHENLGKWLANSAFDRVFLTGDEMGRAAEFLPRAVYFKERKMMELYLEAEKPTGKLILLKGSRGIGLERLSVLL